MDYILVGLTVLAGVVAIRGDTWDATKKNLRERLTGTGKATLVVLIATGLLSTWKQYADNREKADRDEAAKSVINYEIDRSLADILKPFRAMYRDTKNLGYTPDDSITLSMLLSQESLKNLQSVCLDMRPKTFFSIPDAGTWDDILDSDIKSGVNRLKHLVDVYAQQMEPTLLIAVHQFLNSGAFNHRAIDFERTALDGGNTVPKCFANPAADTYKSYLEKIRVITELNGAIR